MCACYSLDVSMSHMYKKKLILYIFINTNTFSAVCVFDPLDRILCDL